MHLLTRGALLKYGAVLAITGVPPDGDLAYARLLVATELLLDDFYSQALRAAFLDNATMAEARANERAHYRGLKAILGESGQVAASAADINFSYPADAFASAASLRRTGAALESLQLGAYLGAADALSSEPLRGIAARIAANEAQHLCFFEPFHMSFPVALTIEQASDALGRYTS